MNENINLCEILKRHEGETFYSPLFGDVTLIASNNGNVTYPIQVLPIDCTDRTLNFNANGMFWGEDYPNGECMLFPSKDQRDWNKWLEEQKSKTPKTWSEYLTQFNHDTEPTLWFDSDMNWEDIGKSCSALFKIHQLIEIGYGGNVLRNDPNHYIDGFMGYTISLKISDKKYLDGYDIIPIKRENVVVTPIMFKTEEYAKEFMSHEENVKLIKTFNMVAQPHWFK